MSGKQPGSPLDVYYLSILHRQYTTNAALVVTLRLFLVAVPLGFVVPHLPRQLCFYQPPAFTAAFI